MFSGRGGRRLMRWWYVGGGGGVITSSHIKCCLPTAAACSDSVNKREIFRGAPKQWANNEYLVSCLHFDNNLRSIEEKIAVFSFFSGGKVFIPKPLQENGVASPVHSRIIPLSRQHVNTYHYIKYSGHTSIQVQAINELQHRESFFHEENDEGK